MNGTNKKEHNSLTRLEKFSSDDHNHNSKQNKILIVEDNPILVKLYSMYLKNNFFIDTAYNGLDAIKKIIKMPPHLILLDIMMPGLDGFSVAQQMSDKKILIPTIVLTAKHLNKEEIELLKKLGITSYFQKDELTQDILLEEIKKYFL
ncbi:MAG: two-component system response regulator [Candidatus Margulisiibacteriota bacterium]|nr:MAG: two-component system response regulator [Candidatus Margulisiibacteriota bacterium]HAR62831.1 two-component system response regulator [Candidatus Margulisiibacteriota bacterium]HCT83649.1 two-component system response regulator [Candidatus Margulisiibacteriota bacterium]HCY35643.1 two-component system response regulator [Candidatus Margulisiibacteriota bacterium]